MSAAARPAPAELPLSFLRSERLGKAIDALGNLDTEDKLQAAVELVALILAGVEDLEAALLSVKVAAGLQTMPPDSAPERKPLVGPRSTPTMHPVRAARRRRHQEARP